MIYYRVKLTRTESGTKWFTPYYFTKKPEAITEAKFWDRFFGKRYNGKRIRMWSAKIVKFKI
jgi:hypothetical protein